MSERGKINVIGAGFTGLVNAYYLQAAGFEVTVYEAAHRVGGIIDTLETELGRVEVAANGILASNRVESLARAIGLTLKEPSAASQKRYFFRDGKVRRWPLSFAESLRLAPRLLRAKKSPPLDRETIEEWCLRTVGRPTYEYLVSPALQGIYAGNPSELSAELILGRFFKESVSPAPPGKSVKMRTLAPAGGMGVFASRLRSYLEGQGVRFHLGSAVCKADVVGPTVVATSLPAMLEYFGDDRRLKAEFSSVKLLSLACVHLTYPRAKPHLNAFGCLFPRSEGVRALGVLYEQSVFGDRSSEHLERWILGGATDPEAFSLSDEALLSVVLEDRAKQLGLVTSPAPIAYHVTRAKEAYPHYDLELRKALYSTAVSDFERDGTFLAGNYLGRLGLSGILEDAEKLPSRIAVAKEKGVFA